MFSTFDFFRHIVLCLHPLSFFFMTVKETIDLTNNYVEIYDWLGNFIGIVYYLLISNLLRNITAKKPFRNLNLV